MQNPACSSDSDAWPADVPYSARGGSRYADHVELRHRQQPGEGAVGRRRDPDRCERQRIRKIDKQVRSTEKELKDVEKQKAQARLQLLEEVVNHEYWQKIERDMEEKEEYLREYIKALMQKDKDDLNLSWTETALDLGYAEHKEGRKHFCLDL
eukprot:768621-Hanusia_phi.AAC.5